MASLFKQSVVLSSARVVTYAVQFVNAIILVRILAPEQYGQYQEFIVYTMLAISFIEFAVNNNLTYFVAKDPSREAQYLSNTTMLNLLFCVIGVVVIYVAKAQIAKMATFDFIHLMVLYIIFYVNLNYLEYYWVAKGKTGHILYYTAALAVSRTATVLVVAYVTRNVVAIIYAVIALQLLKSLGVAIYLLWKRLLHWTIDLEVLKSQLKFVLPLGVGAVVLYFNNEISKVIVSSQLGVVPLAMYAIASRQIPIAGIIRGSAATVIFPEIVRQNVADPILGLQLWKRANVAYAFLMMPLFFLLFYYADVVIKTLFTDEYSRAIPIFRIHLFLLLLRDTVESGSPLRALNQNKYFIYGNGLSLCVNIVALYILFKLFGFYGPAIALVVTILSLQLYLGARIAKSYHIGLRELLLWKKHLIILVVGAACLMVSVVGDLFHLRPLIGAVIFGLLYCVVYLLIMRYLGIEEVDRVMSKVMTKLRLSW